MKLFKGLSVVLVLFFFLSFPVFAEGPNIQLFHPAADATGTFTLYNSSVLEPKDWRAAFILNYGHAPLEINNQTASEGLLTFDATFAMGITKWLELGLDIPIAIRQEAGAGFAAVISDSGLHDFNLFAKINILQASDHWVGLAFIPRVFIPTGEDASYLGDDGGAYGGWFAVDKVWDRFRLMLNLGAMFRPTANVFNNINVRHQMDFGLGAVYEILPEFLFAKGEFSGSTQFANFFSDSLTTPVQFYGGIEVLLKQGFALSLGGSAGLTDSYGTPDWRAVFGATFIPGKSRLFGFKKNKVVAVHFPFNKSVLQLDSYRKIDRFVRNFKRASNKYHVELVGHTDGIGESGANKTLGMRRAQAVRDYLIKRGIEASQIQIHKPSIGTDAPTNMSNRKVVMRLVRS